MEIEHQIGEYQISDQICVEFEILTGKQDYFINCGKPTIDCCDKDE